LIAHTTTIFASEYELEEGETIVELAECIQDMLEGSEVRAPSG
jgi:ornithine carbamoyltransferase